MRQVLTPQVSPHPHTNFEPITEPKMPQNKKNESVAGSNDKNATGVTNVFEYYEQRPYATSWVHGSEIFYS
jgi:hypothetical protein